MSIEVTCIECGASHHVNDRLAGRRVRCPSCDTAVHVPADQPILADSMEETESPDAVEADPVPAEPVLVAPVSAEPVAGESVPVEAMPVSAAPVQAMAGSEFRSPDGADAMEQAPASSDEEEDDDEDEVLPRGNRPEEEMDMTPMVDVTFLLLIFFMVTAAFSLQKSINMPKQQTDAPSTSVIEEETEELDMVELEVDEFGSFLVLAPDWERETPGKQNLISALREAIAGNKDGMKLAIKVHELAKLKALVEAMDAGTIAGFAELEVTQVEDFD